MTKDEPAGAADGPVVPVCVGIVLIGRAGRYLCRRRPDRPGSPMPGVWEFPGGKCEPGETPATAALRECREETGLDVILRGLRRRTVHRYPHGLVELHYFDAMLADPRAEPDAETGFAWVNAEELPTLIFPEANGPTLHELAREASSAALRSDPVKSRDN